MEATKDNISLETAKLLKDYNLFSQWKYCIGGDKCETEYTLIHEDDDGASYTDRYPAYSWWDILRKYPEKFFWHEINSFNRAKYIWMWNWLITNNYRWCCINILLLLQQKDYEQADLYFRHSCILIK